MHAGKIFGRGSPSNSLYHPHSSNMGSASSAHLKTVKDLKRNDPTLTDLDITDLRVGDKKARKLSEALRKNK
jgi:hypothetical protein